MPDLKSSQYWLVHDSSIEEILRSTGYSFETPSAGYARPQAILDTFDGRLHARGWRAFFQNGTLSLHTAHGAIHRQPSPVPPVRIEQLPTGNATTALVPIIKMRALMPLAQYREKSTEIRALDNRQKTVVHLIEHTIEPNNSDAAMMHRIEIQPVRGYDKAAAAIARALTAHGATDATNWPDDIIRACGGQPGGYSSKITVQLSPDQPAAEAAKQLLMFIRHSITTNAAYIPQDVDTEFLHDFRVAVRRTRAALGQLKGVFPKKPIAHFKREFLFLGKMTNALRDLDVYLLAADAYRDMLPHHLRPAIEPLFDHLAAQRHKARIAVSDALQSDRYPQIIAEWDAFLDTPADPSPPAALYPIKAVAQTRIIRQYKTIVKMGNHLLKHPNDDELHQLRLVAKKLRYLLEFFASLFPSQVMKRLIKQLKTLQDNLGAFNDLAVQEEFLLTLALHTPQKTPWPAETTLAIGALVGIFDARKTQVKAEFATIFRDFAAADNQARFKQLFTPPKDGSK